MVNVKSTAWTKGSLPSSAWTDTTVNSTGWTKGSLASTAFTKTTVNSSDWTAGSVNPTNWELDGIKSARALLLQNTSYLLLQDSTNYLGLQI